MMTYATVSDVMSRRVSEHKRKGISICVPLCNRLLRSAQDLSLALPVKIEGL